MNRRTSVGAGGSDFGRILGFLSAVGTVAAAIIILRRYLR